MFKVLNNLVLNNMIIGKRIEYKGWVYDTPYADFYAIVNDFRVDVVEPKKVKNLELKDINGKLRVDRNDDTLELTYGYYAGKRGYDWLKDTDGSLKLSYNEYNKKYFGGKLPTLVCVRWTSRMTRIAGNCGRKFKRSTGTYQFNIALSIPYHERFPDEVEDTLVHEMIHVYHPRDGHGDHFKNTMYRLNRDYDLNITVYSSGRAAVNYIYKCEKCGKEIEEGRKFNTARYTCKKCKGRFKLYKDLSKE